MVSKILKISNIDKPLLTIVIPTYKRSNYLIDAINSAINQINKRYISYEILVINNDPFADMSDLLTAYQGCHKLSIYINEENYGQVGNINQGIKLSRGVFISLLHDDDMLMPCYLDSIYDFIANTTYDCLITPNYLLDLKYKLDIKHLFLRTVFLVRHFYKKQYTEVTPLKNAKSLRNVYGVPTCGMVFKKSSIISFGYFKDISGAAWDYRNFRLFNKNYKMVILNKYVAIRRVYTGMSNKKEIQEEFYQENSIMLKENEDLLVVRKFGKALLDKKPFIKYFISVILSNGYFYLHNLDTTKFISSKHFKDLKKAGIFL